MKAGCINLYLTHSCRRVKVILMDKKKQEILKLSPGSFAGQIELNAKDKYYVYWEFYEASGTCELCWETGSTIR